MTYKGKEYIPYIPFVVNLGLSTHPNHLVRRATRYPGEFHREGDTWYISRRCADLLAAYQKALNDLVTLKRKGGAL